MTEQEYYQHVIEQLRNCYQYAHYVIGAGKELCAESSDPDFPSIAEPVADLDRLTLQRALQVYLPIIGENSQSVLMPLGIEIFLGEDNDKIYTDQTEQRKFFQLTLPCIRFIENLFQQRGLPYLLDYTPSGAHFLFQNPLGYRATKELQEIGYVGKDLIKACNYIDLYDIRRWYGVSIEAASVFSGLSRITEYLSLLAMQEFQDNLSDELLPVTICRSLDRCINFDNAWGEGSPFMRAIRSPFSLNKKSQEVDDGTNHQPLVNVIGTYFNGKVATGADNLETVCECMWSLEKAAEYAQQFTGYIPCANESLIDLINDYRSSDLYLFHQDFDAQENMARGQALEQAGKEEHLPEWTKQMLHSPNPSALDPRNLTGFVSDFLIHAQWQPKHIGNILRDLYQNPGFGWNRGFFKNPAEEKSNFWARTYSAVSLWKTGRLTV